MLIADGHKVDDLEWAPTEKAFPLTSSLNWMLDEPETNKKRFSECCVFMKLSSKKGQNNLKFS